MSEVDQRIGAMTMPEPMANCADLSKIAIQMTSVTIPLLGSRTARAFQRRVRAANMTSRSAHV